jgi:hypothetical protein
MFRLRHERREHMTTLLVEQSPEDVLVVGLPDDRDPVATAIPHHSPLAGWRRPVVAGRSEEINQRGWTILAGRVGAIVHHDLRIVRDEKVILDASATREQSQSDVR